MSGVSIITPSTDYTPLLCALASFANISVDSILLNGITQGSPYLQLSFTINIVVGAYGYTDIYQAYASIVSRLKAAIDSSAFTSLLHTISNTEQGVFTASSVFSDYIEFGLPPVVTVAPSLGGVGNAQAQSTSVQSGNIFASSSFVYFGYAIAGLVCCCCFFFGAIYGCRKRSSGNGGKWSVLSRYKRRSSEEGVGLGRGEIIPEHGDLVDWTDDLPAAPLPPGVAPTTPRRIQPNRTFSHDTYVHV